MTQTKLERFFKIILFIVYVPLLIAGFTLYFCSKIIRFFSYLLMFKRYSAKDEINGFWSIRANLMDDLK